MIPLSLNMAFLIYLGVNLLIVTILSILRHYKIQKKATINQTHKLLQCEYCAFSFLITPYQSIQKCPQCQSYHEMNRI